MKIINGCESFDHKNLALTFGNFDGVHAGHRAVMTSLKKISLEQSLFSAVITFDPHPATIFYNKKHFLLSNLEQKATMISHHKIDFLFVIPFDKEFYEIGAEEFLKEILVKKLNMRYIIVGNNCSFGNKCQGNLNMINFYASSLNYTVKVLQPITTDNITCSSSIIRNYLKDGKIKQANKLLERNHQIVGKVMKGQGIGKLLGFPTANIQISSDILIPKLGVYQAKINVNNAWIDGIVNIGVRPTFHDFAEPLIEVHILNFNDDIYGHTVKIDLLCFIRDEKKFSSGEQLKNQIENDIKKIKNRISL